MDTMMDLIKNTAGYKETGNDYTLEDFDDEELLDDWKLEWKRCILCSQEYFVIQNSNDLYVKGM